MVSTFRWGDGTRNCLLGILIGLSIIAAGLALPSAQAQEGYTSESLFITLYSNGDALVQYDIGIDDPLAQETRIGLFAETSVSNLIVVDEEDNVIEFDSGASPNEIVLRTPGVSSAIISYSTQDLVNKIQGKWIFSLNSSSIGFAVRLPPDSVLIDLGENFPTIKQYGDQQLLTFKPGNVKFVYVIGVIGTEELANIVIRLAQTTIKETGEKFPAIVLTGANDLLQKAIDARDAGKFSEAEKLAGQASDAAIATGRDYEAAQNAIADADSEIRQAGSEGRDTDAAAGLLQKANSEFAAANYAAARNSAEDAVAAIGEKPPVTGMPLFVIIAAVVAAGGGIGAMVFLRMRKPRPAVTQKRMAEEPRRTQPTDMISKKTFSSSPLTKLETQATEPEPPEPMPQVGSQPDRAIAAPATIPESQIDKSVLSRIVSSIVEERTHLRPEDQEVLRYLAEKEGAAFESELRTRFQLPKTTIWRLVKRLEREELVEIRKAGGQNLIKLKFENRQP